MRILATLGSAALLMLTVGVLADSTALDSVVVEPRTVPQERRFEGTIEAVQQATVSSQISGRIEEILFDVDDFVPQGQILVRFRNPEQRAGLERAQANLREARALETQTAAEFARLRKIHERDLISKSALDKAEAEYKAAQARLEAAQAAIVQAEEQLENTLVRAPYSGIVTDRHVEVGELATVGQPLMSGISLNQLRVTTQIPQSYIAPVRKHGTARIHLPGTGIVESRDLTVFPYAEGGSHSFRVRVDLPTGVADLYPGMLVKVGFIVGEAQLLLVPTQALVERSELTGLYVLDAQNRPRFLQVRTGLRHDGEVAVIAGLQAGDRVALDPIAAGVELKRQGGQP